MCRGRPRGADTQAGGGAGKQQVRWLVCPVLPGEALVTGRGAGRGAGRGRSERPAVGAPCTLVWAGWAQPPLPCRPCSPVVGAPYRHPGVVPHHLIDVPLGGEVGSGTWASRRVGWGGPCPPCRCPPPPPLTSSRDLTSVLICLWPLLPSIMLRRICKSQRREGGPCLPPLRVPPPLPSFLTSSLFSSSSSASRKSRVTGSRKLVVWRRQGRKSEAPSHGVHPTPGPSQGSPGA